MPPQQQKQTPPIVQQPPVQSSIPPVAPEEKPPVIPPVIDTPIPATMKKSADAGMLTITADGALKFKLCCSQGLASMESLAHKIRDKCITDAKALYQLAVDAGFKSVLLLDPAGRIATDGHQEPEKPDPHRELFHDDKANPLGVYGRNILHLSMTDEFAAEERRQAAQKNLRYGR